MKVLQVVNTFSHTSIPIEIAAFMGQFVDVDIVSLYDTPDKAKDMAELYAPDCKNIFGCSFRANPIKAFLYFQRILKDGKYDIIHIHHTLSGLLSSILTNRKQSTLMLTIHGDSHSYNLKQNLITGVMLHRVVGIIYNSYTTKTSLLPWQRKVIKNSTEEAVIYNGINTKKIINVNKDFGASFCSKYGLPKDAILIVQIGRLEHVKNPTASLYAFEIFLRNNATENNTFLVIVGDGKERKLLEDYVNKSTLLKERVIFTGMLMREDVYSLMHRINLHIIPSLYEGFCNTLYESLTLGNQLLLSRIPVFEEVLKDIKMIKWFENNNYNAIALSIQNSLKTNKTEEETRSLMDWTVKHFDLYICVKNYLAFYEKLLNKPKL